MSIVGAIVSGLHELQGHAESLMVDACTVVRVTGKTTNPATAAVTPSTTTVYTGKCKVGGDRPYESDSTGGGREGGVQRYILHLPAAAAKVRAGDMVTITAAGQQSHLVGNSYRIAGADDRSLQTAQRVFIDT